jgi:hypothetical protein
VRRFLVAVPLTLTGISLAACVAHPPPGNALEQDMATVQRLLPGQYLGETADGVFRLSIRPAMPHRFLVEARDSASKLVARGELTMMPDPERRRVELLYRPGVPGRGLDGRPVDEPPGIYLDRNLGALQLVCRPRLDALAGEARHSGGLFCVSSLQRRWEFRFDETGMELRRGRSAPPIRMARQLS